MQSLEHYLIECHEKGIFEFRMVVTKEEYNTKVMIHPLDKDGETVDLIVDENKIEMEE